MAAVPAVGGRLAAEDRRARLRRVVQESGMIPALIVVLVVGSMLSDTFLTTTNLENVVRIAAVIGLLAIGQTLVILAGGGGIDLSVGAVMAAAGVIGALYQDAGLVGFIAVAVVTGGLFGLINGLGVTTAGIQPFIVTLATLSIAQGVAFDLSNATPITLNMGGLSWFATGTIGPVPVPIALFAIAVVVGQVFLSRSVWGRELYAVGGNEEAARLSGVRVHLTRAVTFAISGGLAGLAGVLVASRAGSGQAGSGDGIEFTAIAAVVIGGNSIFGGAGAIWRTLVGVFLLALIGNGFDLLSVDPTYQQMVQGGIILLAVAIDAWTRRRS
jgi:ribose transport system permease protein